MATGLVVAYYLLPMTDRLTSGTVTALVCGLIGVTLLFAWQIRTISRSPNPRLRAVEALATTLPLLLLLFSAAYYLLDHAEPGSFNEPLTRTDALYFTLTVFSTVGFGDIAARTQTARVLTMLQMTGNLLLVGVAARIVVSAVRAGLRQRAKEP
ncbi:potassium channel family protein [Streptomyces sp. NPDC002577]